MMNSSPSTSTASTSATPLTRSNSLKRKSTVQPLRIVKLNRRISAVNGYASSSGADADDEDYDDQEESLEWYTGQLSSVITLTSPTSDIFNDATPSQQAFSLPAAERQYPAITCTSPSGQLDPQFPRARTYPPVPRRAPPPVPTPKVARPQPQPKRLPPRMSIPIDMEFDSQLWEDFASAAPMPLATEDTQLKSIPEESEPVEFTVEFGLPGTPIDFVSCSDSDSSFSDSSYSSGPHRQSLYIPKRPTIVSAARPSPTVPPSSERENEPAINGNNINLTPPRVLRSKWSSSTLAASVNDTHDRQKSWKGRLVLGLGLAKKPRVHYALPELPMPTFSANTFTRRGRRAPPTPFVHSFQQSGSSHFPPSPLSSGSSTSSSGEKYPTRRSTSSRSVSSRSSSSYAGSDASTSSGLRRKPIPVEMFLRST